MRIKISSWEGRKGELLERILGERDAIAESDQGRSFRAFYDLLMSTDRQDELTRLLERMLALDPVRSLRPDRRIRRVHYDWLTAAEATQRTVAKLSGELRRYLDDRTWLENRRVLRLLQEIETRAIEVRGNPPSGEYMDLDSMAPEIALPLDRPLYTPPLKPDLDAAVPEAGDDDVPADALFDLVHVDKARLQAQIWRALQAKDQVSLTDLDVLLPAAAIESAAAGPQRFEVRYGLATKPATIRFRLLDPALAIAGLTDITAPVAEFARLDVAATRVFIVENEVTFLAFPAVPGGLVIFGGGYGIDRLATARWLAGRAVAYWGDVDTHGFSILARLRALLPGTRSILMDRPTLLAHRAQWSVEAAPHTGRLDRLDAEEGALYDDLRRDRLGPGVRLEQERIRFGYAQ